MAPGSSSNSVPYRSPSSPAISLSWASSSSLSIVSSSADETAFFRITNPNSLYAETASSKSSTLNAELIHVKILSWSPTVLTTKTDLCPVKVAKYNSNKLSDLQKQCHVEMLFPRANLSQEGSTERTRAHYWTLHAMLWCGRLQNAESSLTRIKDYCSSRTAHQ